MYSDINKIWNVWTHNIVCNPAYGLGTVWCMLMTIRTYTYTLSCWNLNFRSFSLNEVNYMFATILRIYYPVLGSHAQNISHLWFFVCASLREKDKKIPQNEAIM